jgi:hypothetical protein
VPQQRADHLQRQPQCDGSVGQVAGTVAQAQERAQVGLLAARACSTRRHTSVASEPV